MGRRPLARGEFGAIKLAGLIDGREISEASIKAQGLRPAKWRATVLYQDGQAKRPRRLSVEDSSKERARTALARRMEAETSKASAPALGRVTVEDAVRQYISDLEAGKPKRSPATVRTYRSVVNSCILRDQSRVKGMTLADVSPLDLMREMEALAESGKGAHLRHVRAIWGAMFGKAVLSGAITTNPVRLMERQAVERTGGRVYGNGSAHDPQRILSPAEEADLVSRVYADEMP